MAALQLVEDERPHLLFGDLSGLDVRPDLLRREPRVARPERDVHHPDGVGSMSQQLNVDGRFHPGPSYSATPQYLVSRPAFIHNLWKSWGERYHQLQCPSPRPTSSSRVGSTTTGSACFS